MVIFRAQNIKEFLTVRVEKTQTEAPPSSRISKHQCVTMTFRSTHKKN